MMQCDHRRDAALAHAAQHVAITLQRVFIPGIGRRLDAAPLHLTCGGRSARLPRRGPSLPSSGRPTNRQARPDVPLV